MSKLVGIVGAMDIEVSGIISEMTNICEKTYSGIKYVSGKLYGKDAVVAKCGVGKVFAAICAQTMVLEYRPDIIVNTGIAGTLTPELGVKDNAIADRVVQHDMDTSAIGDPIGLISGINKIYIDCDRCVTDLLEKASNLSGIHTLCGTVASGDKFIADFCEKNRIASLFGAVCCEMEGASIGQVCYVNNVPFGIIRTISDGDGEKVDYATFAKEAARNSVKTIKKFFEIL